MKGLLTRDEKGALAEAVIAAAAVRHGLRVAKPLAPARYDLIFDIGSTLVRVQCKWAALVDDVIVVQVRPSRLGTKGYIRRGYTSDEIDAVAAYCGELDRCFLFVGDGFIRRATIHLRLHPARNNQQRGVNWADAFDFGATLTALQGP